MQTTNDLMTPILFDLKNPDALKFAAREYFKAKNIKIGQDKTLAVFTAYCNAVATGAQTLQMNYPDTSFGATSQGTPGQVYPDAEHFLIVAIRILQGSNAVLTKTVWAPGVTDPDILNGRIALNNNGTLMLKDMPLTRFPNSTNNNDLDAGIMMLDVPVLMIGQTNLYLPVIFPVAVAAATTNIRVELIGVKLI